MSGLSDLEDRRAGLDPDRLAALAGRVDATTGQVVVPEAMLSSIPGVGLVSIDTQLLPLVALGLRHFCRSNDEQRALLQACRLIDRANYSAPTSSWEQEALDTHAQLWCSRCGACTDCGAELCDGCGTELAAVTTAVAHAPCEEDS